jgi:dimeric dUTPase (all-alpha-NTP-PPase superfamily)
MQAEFQKRFGFSENMSIEERMNFIHTHSMFLIEETYEMLRELPFHKPWVDYSHLTQEELEKKIEEGRKEFLDIFIFLSNIAIFLDLDEKTIMKMYLEKNNINILRQEDPSLGYINKAV